MSEFHISASVGKATALILVLYFISAMGFCVAVMGGLAGNKAAPDLAYVIAPALSFAASSLFGVRKIYLILFANRSNTSEHNSAFIIYILSRPLFAILLSFLSVLLLQHFIEAVVVQPALTEGFTVAAAIFGLLLGTITGPAIDALIRMGRHSISRMETL